MMFPSKESRFFLLVLTFLGILNLGLIYRIPGILPVAGLIALCIVPGYLLCLLSGIRVYGPLENFLYAAGLSIVFDILFGLGINTILPRFGDISPLSPINLQISYSVIMLLLAAGIFVTGRAPAITLPRLDFSRREKLFLIFGMLILVCSEVGMYLLNAGSTNSVLIIAILLIPVLLLLLICYQDDSLDRIYPIILVLISASLMMIVSLRSNYILGDDINEEYYLFFSTQAHSIWFPDPTLLLNSALSISILPTVFKNFIFTDPQLLYKLLFPLLSLLTPLIIYTIVRKYFSGILALLASCFYIFQRFFVGISLNPRTSVAIIFFALAIMVLCNKELTNAKKYALLILFITGGVLSHYTSSFAFLFLLILAYIIDLVLSGTKNRERNRLINIPLIVFFMGIIFFWYQQTINIVFDKGMEFTLLRKNLFDTMVEKNVSGYRPSAVFINPPLDRLAVYSRLALYALIGLGILFALWFWFRRRNSRDSVPVSSENRSGSLIFIGCVAYAILFISVAAPYLFFQYDTGRISALLFIILAVFLITGTYTLFNPALYGFISPSLKDPTRPLPRFFLTHRNEITAGLLLVLLLPQLFLQPTSRTR